MQPLEKAKSNKGRVNYCDECEQFEIVGNAAYCKADGKMIHPMMLVRGQGTGAAWNCKKRRKPTTNYDRIISKSPKELAGELLTAFAAFYDVEWSKEAVLDWLKQEAEA